MAQTLRQSNASEQQEPVSYHSADFAWEELRDSMQPILAQREAAAAEEAAAPMAEHVADVPLCRDTGSSWEAFHQQHARGRFFRPKRYLTAEFPQLASPGIHVLDVGAGNGASVVPILAMNASAHATCCDISSTALRLLQESAEDAGIDSGRLTTKLLDASADNAELSLAAPADAALLVFTLSAVPPERMQNVLCLAHASLRAGGLLMFRDYALYDLPQLRFERSARLGSSLYRRADGTLAYFFTTEDMRQRALAAGFEVAECCYACVNNVNRRTAEVMRRAFVHAVLRKV